MVLIHLVKMPSICHQGRKVYAKYLHFHLRYYSKAYGHGNVVSSWVSREKHHYSNEILNFMGILIYYRWQHKYV